MDYGCFCLFGWLYFHCKLSVAVILLETFIYCCLVSQHNNTTTTESLWMTLAVGNWDSGTIKYKTWSSCTHVCSFGPDNWGRRSCECLSVCVCVYSQCPSVTSGRWPGVSGHNRQDWTELCGWTPLPGLSCHPCPATHNQRFGFNFHPVSVCRVQFDDHSVSLFVLPQLFFPSEMTFPFNYTTKQVAKFEKHMYASRKLVQH